MTSASQRRAGFVTWLDMCMVKCQATIMRKTNALKLRQSLGSVLSRLVPSLPLLDESITGLEEPGLAWAGHGHEVLLKYSSPTEKQEKEQKEGFDRPGRRLRPVVRRARAVRKARKTETGLNRSGVASLLTKL